MATESGPGTPAAAVSFAGIFRAVDGLRNFKAAAVMIGCTVVGVLVAGLLTFAAGGLGFIAPLLAFVVAGVAVSAGVNAAGLLHMDAVRGISPRSIIDALSQGLLCIPKVIVLALVVLGVELALFLVIALLMLICKIPFLGPLLFTVVFPVSVVVAGITIFSLVFGLVLSLPAIWQGATISRALAQTFAIVRSRLVEAVLLLLGVGLLAFAVSLIVFGVLGAGMAPTVGIASGVLGFSGIGLAGVMQGGGGGGGGHAIAGAIGAGVLWAIAMSLVAQVQLRGLCIVYLRVTDGLDLTAAEASLRGHLDDARRRAAELGDKAKAAARPETPPATPVPPAGTAASSTTPAAPAAPGSTAAAAAAAATGVATASMFAPAPPSYPPLTYPATEDDGATLFPTPAPPAAAATLSRPVSPPSPVAPASLAAGRADDVPEVTLPPRTAAPAFEPSTLPSQRSGADIDLSLGDDGAADIDLPIDDTPSPPPPSPLPPSPAIAAAPAPTLADAAATCPQCAATISGDDVFCGVCGYRLK